MISVAETDALFVQKCCNWVWKDVCWTICLSLIEIELRIGCEVAEYVIFPDGTITKFKSIFTSNYHNLCSFIFIPYNTISWPDILSVIWMQNLIKKQALNQWTDFLCCFICTKYSLCVTLSFDVFLYIVFLLFYLDRWFWQFFFKLPTGVKSDNFCDFLTWLQL